MYKNNLSIHDNQMKNEKFQKNMYIIIYIDGTITTCNVYILYT